MTRPTPIGSRSATVTSIVDGSDRRNAASRIHGDDSSRDRHSGRSVSTMFSPSMPCSAESTSRARPGRCRTRGCDRFAALGLRDHRAAAVYDHQRDEREAGRLERRRHQALDSSTLSRRLDVRAMKALVRWNREGAHAWAPVMTNDWCRRRELQQSIGHRADRAGAERDHDVAAPGDARQRRRDAAQRRHDFQGTPTGTSDRVDQRLEGDAGDRVLAGCVDVSQHDVIGGGQRRSERVEQRRGSAVAMRLERHDDAPIERPRAVSTAAISVGW